MSDQDRPFPHSILKVVYTGPLAHLRGKEALVSAVDTNVGTRATRVRVQFDDTSLKEAYGQHWVEDGDYSIVRGRI